MWKKSLNTKINWQLIQKIWRNTAVALIEMSVIENLTVLSNFELLKVELLAEKSKSVFDDIFPGLHGDNFGEKALDLEDLEEQIDIEDLIKIDFFPQQFHKVCIQENNIENDETSSINDKIAQGKLSAQTTNK